MRRPVFRNEVFEVDAGRLPYSHVVVIIHNNLQQSNQMLGCVLKLHIKTRTHKKSSLTANTILIF